jgi:hypothetical protein
MQAIDNGFQEVVGVVADAGASASRICAATGFTIRHAGSVPTGALTLLGLPPGHSAREVVIGHSGSDRGAIRLVSLDGSPAGLMRDGGQAWDTGGIFDINLRALAGGIEPLHRALGDAGFRAHAPITDWDFGTLAVREVVESDADGLCVALMERVSPPLTGYEAISGPASWVFNSTQVVTDFDAARRILVDGLGWQVVQETEGPAAQPSGANCMGLPAGLAPDIAMRIGIYHPRGRMEGSVEIIAFTCGSNDFSGTTAAPRRGWASLRFPVSDLADFMRRMERAGCTVLGPVAFDWAPHGPVRAAAAVTPWGARFEAAELL